MLLRKRPICAELRQWFICIKLVNERKASANFGRIIGPAKVKAFHNPDRSRYSIWCQSSFEPFTAQNKWSIPASQHEFRLFENKLSIPASEHDLRLFEFFVNFNILFTHTRYRIIISGRCYPLFRQVWSKHLIGCCLRNREVCQDSANRSFCLLIFL